MAMMRTRSQLSIPAPPPSPIPTASGSRSAANDFLAEFIEKSLHVPELALPGPHLHSNTTTRHQHIPAEIDLRLLASASRRSEAVERVVRSAREFGAFRISSHGISTEELKSVVREAERLFGVLEEKDTGFRNLGGNRDEIVWVRSLKDKMEWAREYIGAERYRSFSEEMENIAGKIEGIAEKLGQILVEKARKKCGKKMEKGESVVSVYRYNHHINITEQTPPLPKHMNNIQSSDYTLSLHLPFKNCEFRIHSSPPLSFHVDPDTLLVTFGRQLQEWSQKEFKSVPGEIIYLQPHAHGSPPSFSIELKYSSLNLSPSFNKTSCSKTISILDQILFAILLPFLYYFLLFIFFWF